MRASINHLVRSAGCRKKDLFICESRNNLP